MTAPNETVADILAEMRNSGWPSDAENWADRIDRALRGAVPGRAMTAPNETVADVLAADIRNLIVMDTQFGWRGSTDLTHEDILRLEARGWVAEGHENDEYDFTDEGRAVVERALSAPVVQPAKASGSTPDGPPTITKKVCKGCPHLKTKWWRDDLDNDETDSGTSATCTLADKHITAYWRDNDSPPTWCPLNVPKPTTPEPTHADDR